MEMAQIQINGVYFEANSVLHAQRLAADMYSKQNMFLRDRNPVKTDLASILKPHPDYDFVGHARNKLGIGTKFKVSAILNNSRLTVNAIGGLEWRVRGAASAVVNKCAGTIEAVANDPAGVRLSLVGVAGQLRGRTIVREIVIPVVEPTSAIAVKRGNGYRAANAGAGDLSAYMFVDYWLTPDDVSFVGIEWQEPGGEVANLTGNMANVLTWAQAHNAMELVTHGGNPRTWMSILKERNGQRNFINQTDTVGNTFGVDCGPGAFKWAIAWAYRVKNPQGASKVFKRDVEHILTTTVIGANGTATIQKLGASHTENYTPPAPPPPAAAPAVVAAVP
jgi:hypothetical protein